MYFRYLLLALLFSNLLFPQQVYFPAYHYETEAGLTNLNVLAIQQKKNQILSVVTQGGVYNYSGKMFERQNQFLSLKDIRNIYYTDTCAFLINRDDGIYYTFKNTIRTLFKKNPFKKPTDEVIFKDRFIYNYTEQIAIEIFDKQTNILHEDSLLKKDNLNLAYCILNTNKILFVGRRNGLYKLAGTHWSLIDGFKNTAVFSLFYDETKALLYIGISGKILVYDLSKEKIVSTITPTFSLPNKSQLFLFNSEKNISKLLVDKYDRIWFTTQPDDNMWVYDKGTLYDVLDILNIPPIVINCILLDKKDNIWIGTFNDGLYQIRLSDLQSMKLIGNEKVLSVLQIENINQSYLIATNNGLFVYDKSNVERPIKPLVAPDNLFQKEIKNILKNKNTIYYSDIIGFDSKQKQFNNFTLQPLSFVHFCNYKDTYFFVADIQSNILIYDIRAKKIIDTVYKPTDYRIKVKNIFYSEKINNLYISTNKGLVVENMSGKKITYKYSKYDVKRCEEIDNKIYVLADKYIFDLTSDKVFFNGESFNINTVTSFQKNQTNYFIGSQEGLIILDEKGRLINRIDKKYGLPSNFINDIRINNNQLIISSDKGFSLVDISNVLSYKQAIDVPSLTKITTEDSSFTITMNKDIVIPQQQENLYLYVECPYFNPLGKLTYEYSLDNKEWIRFSNSPLAILNLKGGYHSIKVRATADLIQFTQPLEIKFFKQYKFTETKWFWVTIILSSLLIIVIITLLIIKYEKRKSADRLKTVQQMSMLKHQAMNSILSPHFIFNSLTGIQNYIHQNDTEMASEYLSKFSRLIRMIIEKASQPTIILSEELIRLKYYLDLEKERFHDKFDYEIKIEDNVNSEEIQIPNMIIQPHLENAILHGILPKKEKGLLKLICKMQSKTVLEIIMEDNGVGVIKASERKQQHHKSLATQTIAEILKINSHLYSKKQSVTITDKSTIHPHDSGTIVKIEIEL